MSKVKDLTGQRFGSLTVLEQTDERRNRQVVWKCRCDCGNITYVVGQSLRSGHTKTCGCSWYKQRAEDLTGKRFGKLTVLNRSEKTGSNRTVYWDCICDCGNTRTVDSTSLRNETVTACYECIKKQKVPVYGLPGPIKDLTNQKFNFLTVLELVKDQRDNAGRAIWKCQCDCGNICYVSSNKLITNTKISCGCKKMSTGEKIIFDLLTKNNINFKYQYVFKDCLSPKNSPLIYDFVIFDEQNKPIKIIEYDGLQHFKSIEYFGGEEKFLYLQKCDKIKNDYCKKYNIDLIRIPYTQKNNINLELLDL